ncbi:MAG TPA: protein TolA, partial [Methylobacterium sp.]
MSTLALTDDPGPRPSGVAPAFVVALCLHVAALTGLALYTPVQPAPPGENSISIDLAPQMTEADTQAPAQQAQSEFAPPVANPVDTPETVSELTPPETVAVPPPDTAEVQPEEATTAKPAEAQATPPTEAQATPVTEARVEPQPDTLAETQPEDQVVTSTSEQAEPLAPPPPVAAKPPD